MHTETESLLGLGHAARSPDPTQSPKLTYKPTTVPSHRPQLSLVRPGLNSFTTNPKKQWCLFKLYTILNISLSYLNEVQLQFIQPQTNLTACEVHTLFKLSRFTLTSYTISTLNKPTSHEVYLNLVTLPLSTLVHDFIYTILLNKPHALFMR